MEDEQKVLYRGHFLGSEDIDEIVDKDHGKHEQIALPIGRLVIRIIQSDQTLNYRARKKTP